MSFANLLYLDQQLVFDKDIVILNLLKVDLMPCDQIIHLKLQRLDLGYNPLLKLNQRAEIAPN